MDATRLHRGRSLSKRQLGAERIEMENLCIFCEHLEWLNERAMGSSWTGEYGTSGFSCKRGHFDAYGKGEDRSFHDINDVRGLFLIAENCADYMPPNGVGNPDGAALSRQSGEPQANEGWPEC